MASKLYPLGKRGPIIGTPYSGTHRRGNWQSDNAVDIAVPVGTPVYAAADGVIGPRIGPQNSKDPRLAGLRVTVQGAGNSFYYGHLSRLTVSAGQHVTAGELIGYSGEANGTAHLHFAVQKGTPGDAIRGTAPPIDQAQPQTPLTGNVTAGPTTVTPPATGTPPIAGGPSVEMPGTAQHYLPGAGPVADSWQQVAQLPDLSPDTMRLIQLASGGSNAG